MQLSPQMHKSKRMETINFQIFKLILPNYWKIKLPNELLQHICAFLKFEHYYANELINYCINNERKYHAFLSFGELREYFLHEALNIAISFIEINDNSKQTKSVVFNGFCCYKCGNYRNATCKTLQKNQQFTFKSNILDNYHFEHEVVNNCVRNLNEPSKYIWMDIEKIMYENYFKIANLSQHKLNNFMCKCNINADNFAIFIINYYNLPKTNNAKHMVMCDNLMFEGWCQTAINRFIDDIGMEFLSLP